jgi:hypothetical protein
MERVMRNARFTAAVLMLLALAIEGCCRPGEKKSPDDGCNVCECMRTNVFIPVWACTDQLCYPSPSSSVSSAPEVKRTAD